jgi:hypothetical protein
VLVSTAEGSTTTFAVIVAPAADRLSFSACAAQHTVARSFSQIGGIFTPNHAAALVYWTHNEAKDTPGTALPRSARFKSISAVLYHNF